MLSASEHDAPVVWIYLQVDESISDEESVRNGPPLGPMLRGTRVGVDNLIP